MSSEEAAFIIIFRRVLLMDKSFYIGNRQRFAVSMRPGSILPGDAEVRR